ncbi:uroporphyrinogen decarboxylase family protein [Alkalibacter mobilis]|uniref:uroporphyrinogen decarboxylase family protein n=1 Tax=Alkalibacter mobilis TaxID=2787712 RepID=UPI00189F0D82|nr:uroporphyrinogen decarboxylase family protein [Alkalibacter mobilis]MBF7097455.1 hypothetical protein [Alkalibacter mobilis]
MKITKELYDERFNRVVSAVRREIPDRVPVMPMVEEWVMHHADISLIEAFKNSPDANFEAYKKTFTDVYVDAQWGNMNIFPIDVMSNFGEGLYVLTDHSLQIKGSHGNLMNADEYDQLISDPVNFIGNTLIPRKFPSLTGDKQEIKNKFFKAFDDFKVFLQHNAIVNKRVAEELGIPFMAKGALYTTPDIVMDFLRDFVGTMGDIKRYPDKFYAACDSLFDYTMRMLTSSYTTPEDNHWIFSPLHLPTYLKPKDFEKLYFPFLYKMVDELCVKRGYNQMLFMENLWEPYYEILSDLPKTDKLVGLIEKGDLKKAKDSIGNKMCIMGGMQVDLLARGSVEQCIDQAKWCLDELAPGGGYIFSTDSVIMSHTDAKAENLIAVCDYIHENGVY